MKIEAIRPTALRVAAASAACLAISGMALAQDRGKISIDLFSDYYTVLEHNNPAINGMNGFWFRRIYLTYDREMDDGFAARFRLQAMSAGNFAAAGALGTTFKDLYISHTGENRKFYFGMSPSPATESYEKFHSGYRGIEKTPLDLYGMVSTRDTGIAVQGSFGNGGTRYWGMVGNDSGVGQENNKGKAFYLTLNRELSESMTGEVNMVYADKPGGDHWTTLAGFLGFTGEGYDASLFYGHQARSIGGGPDVIMDVLSFFVAGRGSGNSSPFLRIDLMGNPVPGGNNIPYLSLATTANPMLFIVGVDMTLSSNVHVIPSLGWVTYQGGAPNPSNDLIFRLSLNAKF